MRILGVDPGYAIMGYGVVDYIGNRYRLVCCGAILTEAGEPMPERLRTLYAELTQVIVENEPDVASIEELFFNDNAKTAIKVGEARGAAILACANLGVPVYEYTPLQIKQALVGYGRATKEQVQEMVRQMLGLKAAPKPDDVADAVAAAITHANASGYVDKLARIERRAGGKG
ncbi:MAG: crossover junction endodeoxyribonuclease RuvC [Clostridiales Family XIII bacterium]|jgi:crossover junction endodeoxyribonuclease RuvC|nr:crossover junction endodeoxyribonuclease RuvC [Clostridiales Family XIII bacterium]